MIFDKGRDHEGRQMARHERPPRLRNPESRSPLCSNGATAPWLSCGHLFPGGGKFPCLIDHRARPNMRNQHARRCNSPGPAEFDFEPSGEVKADRNSCLSKRRGPPFCRSHLVQLGSEPRCTDPSRARGQAHCETESATYGTAGSRKKTAGRRTNNNSRFR